MLLIYTWDVAKCMVVNFKDTPMICAYFFMELVYSNLNEYIFNLMTALQ